jgi:hypothetical protein
MPFDQGNNTFRICSLPEPMPSDSIERFAEYAARALDEIKDEPQWGWVSPRHLLDSNISDETIRAAGFYHLCLRQAERKIPSSLLTAECRMVELARMAEKGHERLGRKERKTIKEEVQQRLLPKMPPQISGMYFAIDARKPPLHQRHVGQPAGYVPRLLQKKHRLRAPALHADIVASERFELDPASIPAWASRPNPPRRRTPQRQPRRELPDLALVLPGRTRRRAAADKDWRIQHDDRGALVLVMTKTAPAPSKASSVRACPPERRG